MDKKGLRNLGKLLRDGCDREGFGEYVYGFLKNIPEYEKASLIMLYLSLPKEAPTDYLLKAVLSDGKKVCVPVTEDAFITPCKVDKDTTFEEGCFGVREPNEKMAIPAEEIDICIVPGILFDKAGSRCGYGKGCYDRFLSGLSATKVGLAFEKQVIELFPSEEYDIKMDYIITEKGLVTCEE